MVIWEVDFRQTINVKISERLRNRSKKVMYLKRLLCYQQILKKSMDNECFVENVCFVGTKDEKINIFFNILADFL